MTMDGAMAGSHYTATLVEINIDRCREKQPKMCVHARMRPLAISWIFDNDTLCQPKHDSYCPVPDA
jgi:hypothetical protein